MLVFLDLKTTGYEAEDKICAITLLDENRLHTELVNEGKKITPEASAVHHITNKHIKDQPPFRETKIYTQLQQLGDEDVLVVHDYQFVQNILQSYDLQLHAKIVDTKRIVKHTISEIERYDLHYLRYELQLLDQDEVVYKPLEDVVVIKSLFEYLQSSVSEAEMFDLSFQHVLLEKLNFGKYNGRYVEEILHSDPQYLHWMLSLENLDADLRYTIEYYLQG